MRAKAQAVAEATGRTYRETSNRFENGEAGLEQTLRAYERSDLVLSSRLHGCVMAFAMGRPALAVSGDGKIDSFMRAAGLDAYLVDHHDLSDLAQRLLALPEQVVPRKFVDRERTANLGIAGRVRALTITPHSDRRRLGSVVGPAS
jgi:polysaccharide pyruvyl transferase WcaK-like protein